MMIVLAILLLGVVVVAIRKIRQPGKSVVAPIGCIGLAIILVTGVILGPITPSLEKAEEFGAMQTCRTIALAEFQYANDNGGRYPDGNSSTEVFQKLIDGNYVGDSAIFYVPMPGKERPKPGERLKPENVCYDVTGGVDSSAPEHLPLVFLTGFKVDYRPGGQAVSLSAPRPSFYYGQRTWWQWINFQSGEDFGAATAVAYHDNSAFVRLLDLPNHPLQTRTFLPQDFDPHGKTYRQLTPDGVLK